MRSALQIAVLGITSSTSILVSGFTCLPSVATTRSNTIIGTMTSTTTTVLFDTATPDSNEFPRPLNTDRILKTSSGKRRANRDHQVTITAGETECVSLAKRFELKHLTSLSADLSLRPPEHYASNSGGLLTVQVEGTIHAHLTQTCVRTNEDFEVEVEFPIQSVVKPIANNYVWEEDTTSSDADAGTGQPVKTAAKKTKSKQHRNGNLRADRLNNMNDMMDLQNMLDQMDDTNGDGNQDVIEDESIYSLLTGNLDVGELVAQTFWLNLDPYPKKPGTGPIEISISG